jgi:hypothetical protein
LEIYFMRSIVNSFHRRRVKKYNKKAINILRFLFGFNKLREYLGPFVRLLSVLHPDIRTCFRFQRIQRMGAIEGVRQFSQFNLPVYTAKPQYDFKSYSLTKIKEKAFSLYHLNDVGIVGSSSLIHCDDSSLVYESYCTEHDENYKFDDEGAFVQGKGFFITRFRRSCQTIEHGILLSGNHSGNYYHFVYQILSRFYLI